MLRIGDIIRINNTRCPQTIQTSVNSKLLRPPFNVAYDDRMFELLHLIVKKILVFFSAICFFLLFQIRNKL